MPALPEQPQAYAMPSQADQQQAQPPGKQPVYGLQRNGLPRSRPSPASTSEQADSDTWETIQNKNNLLNKQIALQQRATPLLRGVPLQTCEYPSSGRKKAVLIGINYINHPTAQLSGCIHDAMCMKYLLQTKFAFPASQIVTLTDDNVNPNYQPTRRTIINSLGWLTNGVQPGDSLFLYFSGHGSQMTDVSGDEVDGLDETICPMDWETQGMILDDDLHEMVCAPPPQGAKVTAVMDCCHSGTGLDLPYTYCRNKHGFIQPEVDQTAICNGRETLAQVVLFSGCADSQTSADTRAMSGVLTGAATFAFIQSIESYYPNLTLMSLLDSMSAALKARGYEQTAYLSCGHAMNLLLPFHI